MINTYKNATYEPIGKSELSVRILDDSMSPFYLKNDRVYFEKQAEYKNGDDIIIDGYTVYTGSYALNGGGRVKVMAVNHPSVGYSWDYWHKVISAFLNK